MDREKKKKLWLKAKFEAEKMLDFLSLQNLTYSVEHSELLEIQSELNQIYAKQSWLSDYYKVMQIKDRIEEIFDNEL